jgi:DNA-binding helix-hairpin-helix protein with protein kinase domain
MKVAINCFFIGLSGFIMSALWRAEASTGGEVLGILITVLMIGLYARRYWRAVTAAEKAERQLSELKRLWEHQPDDSSFQALVQHLDQITQSYFDLPAVQQRRLAELGEGLRKRQLERHLDLYRIDGSGLAGLEPGILATLQSYGIETAADAIAANLSKVPGLDQDLIDRLYAWRQQFEDSFLFDAGRGIDPDDLGALHDAMDEAGKDFERELLGGPEQLRKSADSIARRRVLLKAQITAAVITRDMAVEKLYRMVP